MKFRTQIKLASQQENRIDYTSNVLLLGSCFSENIGKKLSYYQFDALANPFGVLFSAAAIAKVLEDTVNQKTYQKKDLIEQNGVYHSLHHHSDLSAIIETEVLENIHQAQKSCLEQLKKATHIVITLGTSWVYKYLTKNQLVANCHKIPQTEFEKKMLSVEKNQQFLEQILQHIRKVNTSAQIIFTVSPVRHLKDGMIENSLSKSSLLLAIHKVIKTDREVYFGSYEMMMDDLRDYRFYETDMIHPNSMAIDYIWEQFSSVWICEKAQCYFKKIASVQQGKFHKPFHPNSESHRDFLKNLTEKQKQIEQELNIKFNA